MKGIDRLSEFINTIFYIMLGLSTIGYGVYYILKKKGFFDKKSQKEDEYKKVQEKEMSEFLGELVDDIKYDMIIRDNYNTFIAGVQTNGTDYLNSTESERLNIRINYCEYVQTIDRPTKIFVQAKDDDITGYLDFYAEIKENYMKKINALKSDIKQLHKTLSEIKPEDHSSFEIIQKEINKKTKSVDNLEWAVRRIDHKEHYIKQTASSEKRDKFESYVFIEYRHNDITFGADLTREEKIKRAKDILDVKVLTTIRGHAKARVNCNRLTGNEMAMILRSTINPLDGDQFTIKDIFKSNMFSQIATADNEETLKKQAVLATLEGK